MSRALDDALDSLAHACATFAPTHPSRTPTERTSVGPHTTDLPVTPSLGQQSGASQPLPSATTAPGDERAKNPAWSHPRLDRTAPPTLGQERSGFRKPVSTTDQHAIPPAESVSRWRRISSAATRIFHRYTPW